MNTTIKVTDIPNIHYIGDIIIKDTKSKGKWKLDYKCSKEIQKQENGDIIFLEFNFGKYDRIKPIALDFPPAYLSGDIHCLL